MSLHRQPTSNLCGGCSLMDDTCRSSVRAVILCAGRGSRLGALTQQIPKSLTVLAGHSLLEWKLRALKAAGIEEVYALTGYGAEAFANSGLACIRNDRWAQTNMVASLLCANAVLERPGRTLICYGDVVFHPDIVQATLAHCGDIVLPYDTDWRALWEERFSDPLSDAESFAQRGGLLEEIGARVGSLDSIQGQFMGVLSVTQRGWRNVTRVVRALPADTVDRLDTTSLLARLIADGIAVHTMACAGRWVEVDTQADLDLYQQRIKARNWHHDWRWEI